MRSYAKRGSCFILALTLVLLAACRQEAVGYGFTINDVVISPGNRSLDIHVDQVLSLSDEARLALRNGVTLTLRLELQLLSDNDLMANQQLIRLFQIRYLPLSERFQLSGQPARGLGTYSRLRYVLAAINTLDVRLPSGSLLPGGYVLRARMQLDRSRLPAPMQLPAMFSSQWRHDSDWTEWSFQVNA